jgi:hypothetical protein
VAAPHHGPTNSFLQKPLRTSLLNLDAEHTKIAVEISRKIFLYMQAKISVPLAEILPPVQVILQRGLDSDADIRDEIYAQLIKQMNDNPHQEYAERLWELLNYCCCVFPPSSDLAKYLQSYLDETAKKEGSPFVRHASFALRSLSRLGQTGARQLIPSLMELMSLQVRPPGLASAF